ncbi:MAG: hypothetical protein KF681_01660 [Bdellovibrionaceae bacterium]|nr:hypothetical protein [Pseudobdellovibrionaceae bacterium]
MLRPALLLLFFLSACATNNQKRLTLAAASFAGGTAIGAASAPADERKELHAVYWGALLGLGAAVAGNYLFNDETELAMLNKENQRLKAELDLIQTGNKILVDQGKGKFKNPVGETELQGKKAHWKIYQLDRWTKEGPNRLYHQDKMIEITPLGEAP